MKWSLYDSFELILLLNYYSLDHVLINFTLFKTFHVSTNSKNKSWEPNQYIKPRMVCALHYQLSIHVLDNIYKIPTCENLQNFHLPSRHQGFSFLAAQRFHSLFVYPIFPIHNGTDTKYSSENTAVFINTQPTQYAPLMIAIAGIVRR